MPLTDDETRELTLLVVKHGVPDAIMRFVVRKAIIKLISNMIPVLPTKSSPVRVLRLDRQLPRYEPKLLPQFEEAKACICEQCTLQRFGYIYISANGVDYSFKLIRFLVCKNKETMPFIPRWRVLDLFVKSNVDMFMVRDSLVDSFKELTMAAQSAKLRLMEFDEVIRRFNEENQVDTTNTEQRALRCVTSRRGKRRKHSKRSVR